MEEHQIVETKRPEKSKAETSINDVRGVRKNSTKRKKRRHRKGKAIVDES